MTLVAAFASTLIVACAATPPPKATTTGTATSKLETTSAQTEDTKESQPQRCELVCEGAQVVPRPADTPDYHAAAVANADNVIAAMHDDLLACYKRRVAVYPQAQAFLTVDIIVSPDGSVRDVEATGGALLGNAAMSCIVSRIKAATFEPVYGGGTRHIAVPLTLRRLSPDQSI